jgi:hypothetical protein
MHFEILNYFNEKKKEFIAIESLQQLAHPSFMVTSLLCIVNS